MAPKAKPTSAASSAKGRSPLQAKKPASKKSPASKPSRVFPSANPEAKPLEAKVPPQEDVPAPAATPESAAVSEKNNVGEGSSQISAAESVEKDLGGESVPAVEPAADHDPEMEDMEEIEEIEEEIEEIEEEIAEEVEEMEDVEEVEEVEDISPASKLIEISAQVDDLRGLSAALSTFTACWDDLRKHFDKIQSSMENLAQRLEPRGEVNSGKEEKQEEKKTDGRGEGDNSAASEDLETICEKMLGRNLRRYVVTHISEINRLREEVPKALRLAPNPTKFLLNCIGRFYLQGCKAYADPNATMIPVRRACVLVLEFFLLSGIVQDETPPIDEEAKVAAIAWKNRLITEGGVSVASPIDALGLALFVGSFGIPSEFSSDILYDLFKMSNLKKKANVLRKSKYIVDKLPDMIQDLVQKEKYMAAADLVCGFGMQDKHPPLDLISSFLIKTNTDASEERREAQASLKSLRDTTANELAAYKAVLRCLEDYKLDSSPLSGFKIHETVGKLERELSKLDKRMKEKAAVARRKAGELEMVAGPLLPPPIIHRPLYDGYGERRPPPPDVLPMPSFPYQRSWSSYDVPPPTSVAVPGRVGTPERAGSAGAYRYEEVAGEGDRYYVPSRPSATGYLHRPSYLN